VEKVRAKAQMDGISSKAKTKSGSALRTKLGGSNPTTKKNRTGKKAVKQAANGVF